MKSLFSYSYNIQAAAKMFQPCIYYVGHPQNSSSPQRLSSLRRTRVTPRTPPSSKSTDIVNLTKSTSCPKTQRSSLMKNKEYIRKMSPVYRRNVGIVKKAIQNMGIERKEKTIEYKTENKEIWTKYKSKIQSRSKISDVFEVLKGERTSLIDKGQKKIKLNKVEQPKHKNVRFQTEPTPISPIKAPRTSKATFRQLRTPLSQIPQSPSSAVHSLLSIYKAQPSAVFLCTRCYQFFPIFQSQTHHLNCKISLYKAQFISKFQHLTQLLQQISEHTLLSGGNNLYRLVDRMKWYIKAKPYEKNDGNQVLYSEQLQVLLNMKGQVKIKGFNKEEVFWVIQNLGDLIQTKGLEIDESAFWRICT